MPDNGDNPRMFQELDVANVSEYAILVYEVWRGERDDPATQIEEWMSLFKQEDLPEEYDASAGQFGLAPPYIELEQRYRYRDEFEGLVKAFKNDKLRVVKKTDRDAERHQQESESMLGDTHNRRYHSIGEIDYEAFLNAVDRVGENEDDKEAWDIIDTWRSRRLRQEERSL